jgi:hypothetical protein
LKSGCLVSKNVVREATGFPTISVMSVLAPFVRGSPMSTLATIPSDVLSLILFPEVSLHSATVEMPLHRMIDLHVWRQRTQAVLSDLRRLRFFAYTNGPVLRATTTTTPRTHVFDDDLPRPIPYWSSPPSTHLHGRYDTEYA